MFLGFTEETIAFLWGIRLNNEREWFMAHKAEYQSSVLAPMQALAQDAYEGLHSAFPQEELFCKVSRIYRDARRLFGRGPYKDHLWFSLRRGDETGKTGPCLWFEITPEGYAYGMGFYEADPETMAAFRRELDAEPQRFLKLAKAVDTQEHFTLSGQEYLRKKAERQGALAQWYNRKFISIDCRRPYDELSFSPALTEELVQAYTELMPLYRYFDRLHRRTEK